MASCGGAANLSGTRIIGRFRGDDFKEHQHMGKPYARASSTPSAAPEAVDRWVHEVCALTEPDRVHWCTGSEAENDFLSPPSTRGTFLFRCPYLLHMT